MNPAARAVRRETSLGLTQAVHRSRALSRAGLSERLFTLAFSGLVYPQIWEDPAVDLEALALRPTDHVVAIASGSCNVLSYLTADPARISAVDLNGAHIALGRLKLAALTRLPDAEAYLRFFGRADSPANVAAYDVRIAPISIRSRGPIGRRGASTGAGASPPSPRTSSGTACSGASSAPGTGWPGSMAATSPPS